MQFSTGHVIMKGQGAKRNLQAALKWMHMATAQGHPVWRRLYFILKHNSGRRSKYSQKARYFLGEMLAPSAACWAKESGLTPAAGARSPHTAERNARQGTGRYARSFALDESMVASSFRCLVWVVPVFKYPNRDQTRPFIVPRRHHFSLPCAIVIHRAPS